MDTLRQDLLHAFRSVSRRPGFALLVVATLALGIGAVTTVFSWFERVVVDPLPGIAQGGRLATLGVRDLNGGRYSLSYPDLVDYREGATQLAGLTATDMRPLSLAHGGEPERVWALLVSNGYFDVLGVRAERGRLFRSDEGRTPGGDPVAVLSFDYWQRRFGGRDDVVGEQVTLNTTPFTVVGVAPEAFKGTDFGLTFDVYVPLTMAESFTTVRGLFVNRGNHWLDGIARLAPGATLESAQAELGTIAARLGEAFPDTNRDQTVVLLPLHEDSGSGSAMLAPLIVVLGAFAVLVLLVACANVANLMLAKAELSKREIAVRLAVGSSRWRLVRLLLVESLVLAGLGGVVGYVVAWQARSALMLFAPPTDLPVGLDIPMSSATFCFAALATALTAAAFGLVPAMRASRPDLVRGLRAEVTSTGGRSRSRLTRGLVAAQVTLSLVLLVSAGLFLASHSAAMRIDPGFDPDGVLLAAFDLQHRGYDEAATRSFDRALIDRLDSAPGVVSATLAQRVPLELGGTSSSVIAVEGYEPKPDERVWSYVNVVGPAYFRTMRTAVEAGRELSDSDDADAPPVVVVSRTLADRYWPGRSPLGTRLRCRGRWYTVVGVAADISDRRLGEPGRPYMYLSVFQSPRSAMTIHVRTDGDPAARAGDVRRIVAEIDPSLPLYGVRTLSRTLAVATFQTRIGSRLLTALGSVALLLAAVGLFGVLSRAVARRRREVGIRMALGGAPRRIVRMVLADAFGMVGVGAALGTAASVAAGYLLRGVLTGGVAVDPTVLVLALLLMAAVTAVVCIQPAWRVTHSDPLRVLRAE